MLANYFDPTAKTFSMSLTGLGTTNLTSSLIPSMGGLVSMALRAGCGYYIGGFFGHKIAGAALAGFLGLPGLFGLALFSKPIGSMTRNEDPNWVFWRKPPDWVFWKDEEQKRQEKARKRRNWAKKKRAQESRWRRRYT